MKRVNQEEVNAFYSNYGFNAMDSLKKAITNLQPQISISNHKVKELSTLLPKQGNCFMSMVTQDVDSIHNLVYGSSFQHYFHMDFSLPRLMAVKNELPRGTQLVLGDIDHLPFKRDSVDALFSFDHITDYGKEMQKECYSELKRCLKDGGVSIVLYDKAKPLYAKTTLFFDQLAQKVLKALVPWRKVNVPNIYFCSIDEPNPAEQHDFIAKTSLSRQFT